MHNVDISKKEPGTFLYATLTWLNGLTDDLHGKLARKGLDKARFEPAVVEPKKPITVREYCDAFSEAIKSDVKLSSQIFYQHVVKRLKEFFGDQPLESVTPMDAKKFRTWLEVESNKRDKPDDDGNIKPLAQNTVRRRIGACKKIFGDAINDGLLNRNPFADLPSTVRSNKDRKKYVPMSDFQLVLNQAPDAKWKLLMLLARIAAFRVPSEVATLRWSDIDINKKRMLEFYVRMAQPGWNSVAKVTSILLPRLERPNLGIRRLPYATSTSACIY